MNIKRIPKIFRNFYFLFTLGFFFWVLFLDANDLVTQIERTRKQNNLEKERAFFQEKIKEVELEREELMSDNDLLEKFAREKYLMKKPEEDVYVIVRQ